MFEPINKEENPSLSPNKYSEFRGGDIFDSLRCSLQSLEELAGQLQDIQSLKLKDKKNESTINKEDNLDDLFECTDVNLGPSPSNISSCIQNHIRTTELNASESLSDLLLLNSSKDRNKYLSIFLRKAKRHLVKVEQLNFSFEDFHLKQKDAYSNQLESMVLIYSTIMKSLKKSFLADFSQLKETSHIQLKVLK